MGDLAARDVSVQDHQGGTNVRDQDPESVNIETDLDRTPEKESMNVQEKGSEIVSVIMRGHTVVKGTMTEPEIGIEREIVKGKGKYEHTVMEQKEKLAVNDIMMSVIVNVNVENGLMKDQENV